MTPVTDTTDSSRIYGNEFTNCDIGIRISSMGYEGDTFRCAFIYNNVFYADSANGMGVVFHEDANYVENIDDSLAHPPDIWFYHNSWAGLGAWGGPIQKACARVKCINNIFSTTYLPDNTTMEATADSFLFTVFDYNFLGGSFSYYGKPMYAVTDGHNQWPTDSTNGSKAHQVWSLGSEPNFVVPDTSTAYEAALDLSDSFEVRGVDYAALPGMTGYHADLGAWGVGDTTSPEPPDEPSTFTVQGGWLPWH